MESILTDLTRTKELLSLINVITRVFVDKPNDSGFVLVLDEIVKFMRSDYGVLGYLSKDSEYLTAAVSGDVWDICGVPDGEKVVFTKHNWKGVWAEIIYNGTSQLINGGDFKVPGGHVSIKNVLGTAIKRQGEIIGYFLIASNTYEYDRDDLALLEWLANWCSPVIYNRLKELEYSTQMEKIQLSILEMLNYANMYVLILDEKMRIKFINYSLAIELGFKNELEPLGRCWLDFILDKDREMIKNIHSVISTTDEREKYKELVSDICKLDNSIITVKWFNIRINHKYNWTFSFGINRNKTVEITEDSLRAYWEDKVLRDTTMIQSMRDLLTREKKEYDDSCTPESLM